MKRGSEYFKRVPSPKFNLTLPLGSILSFTEFESIEREGKHELTALSYFIISPQPSTILPCKDLSAQDLPFSHEQNKHMEGILSSSHSQVYKPICIHFFLFLLLEWKHMHRLQSKSKWPTYTMNSLLFKNIFFFSKNYTLSFTLSHS